MTRRGLEFANEWMLENINVGLYAFEPGNHPDAEQFVEQLVADAHKEGITHSELKEGVGDLAVAISAAFKSVTDEEIDRLSRKHL